MPLSPDAVRALEGAVCLNPGGASQLLITLRTAPFAVSRHGGGRLGPLGHLVADLRPTAVAPEAVRLGVARPALPPSLAAAAGQFHREWQAGLCTIAELADVVEHALARAGHTIPNCSPRWRSLRPATSPPIDPLGKLFPAG